MTFTIPPDASDYIARPEFSSVLTRMERHADISRAEILTAIRDLKISMNGQFAAQGKLLAEHETRLAVHEDRGKRDLIARWGAGLGSALAVIAGYLSLR